MASQALSLDDFLQRVWAANELLQVRAIEAAITDEQLEAERAIFDPVFVGQFDAVDRRRPNTTEQAANLGFSPLFNERNRTYQAAVEKLAPLGGRLRMGYTVSELNNNLNARSFAHGEFISTVGLTLVQPLLKGAGKTVTMAGIRAAAINSDIGFQDYRRGMMEVLGRAEIAYWDLYEAQEQHRIALESLRLANALLTDSRKRLEVGKGTPLSAMQAEAGVALREATRLEASRRLTTARSRVIAFQGGAGGTNAIVAADAPAYVGGELVFRDLWAHAYQSSPDFVALRKRAELDGLRVVVAKSVRLPQLDLTAGYGFSGIGSSPGAAVERANSQDFPDWSIGLQFRVPIGGDDKARHEHKAAELRRKATALGIENFGRELESSIRAAVHSVTTFRENGALYQKVVGFNEKLLDSQIKRSEAGQADSRDVLEAEEDLFEVRITGIGNQVRYRRALLELEMLSGVLLSKRGLDLSRADLRQRTEVLRRAGSFTEERYQEFLRLAEAEYQRRKGRVGGTPSEFDTSEAPGSFKWNGFRNPLTNDEYLEQKNPAPPPLPVKTVPVSPENEKKSGFFKWNGF